MKLNQIRTPRQGGSEPFPVSENDIVHCVIILQGFMSWGFRLALPLTGGFRPMGLCSGFYVRQSFPRAMVAAVAVAADCYAQIRRLVLI